MTEVIQFFQFDEDEYARRVADVELEYELTKPDTSLTNNRYRAFFKDYFPIGTRFEHLPGQYELFYTETGPDTAISKILDNAKSGYGEVSDFSTNVSPDFVYRHTRWHQVKPTQTIKADKAMLAELVKQRYLSDLEEMNKAEEVRQVELLVQQAERKRIADEEARIQTIREQARADLLSAYNGVKK